MGVLEIMGYGVVLVVNDGLSSKELVENGVDGFVVRDYEEAAQAISDLLEDEPRRSAMSLAT
jgi:glycosyltransferase involved in cell wall biosynthesis